MDNVNSPTTQLLPAARTSVAPNSLSPAPAVAEVADVVMVANASKRERRSLLYLLGQGPKALSFYGDPWALRDHLALDGAPVPKCIVLDMTAPGAKHFIAWIRGNYRYGLVPIVGLAASASNVGFRNAYAAGVDEVVLRHDRPGLVRRMERLLKLERLSPIRKDARDALLLTETVHKRQVLGRVLRTAGFNVTFTDTKVGAMRRVQQSRFDLVVVETAAEDKAWEMVKDFRALSRPDLPAVVVADLSALRPPSTARPDRTALLAQDSPADDLLFASNEVMMPEQKRLRGSARQLYGTTCAYREPGRLHPRYGYTYNLSATGVYVRTMDPPEVGTLLWLSLTPPYAAEPVDVCVKVMWVCAYGSHVGGASPWGFGAQIVSENNASSQMAQYLRGYERIQQANPVPSDEPAWQSGTVEATLSSVRITSFLPVID